MRKSFGFLAAGLLAVSGFGATALPPVVEGHPRLLARAADFERLRADDSELARLGKAKVLRTADWALKRPPAEYRKTGRRLLAVSQNVLTRALTLSMAWRLTGERKYAAGAIAEAERASAFPNWNNDHFLDTAEMGLAVALVYDWLYDELAPDARRRLETAIHDLALVDGNGELKGRGWWWENAANNWGQVCHGGLIACAVALADVYPEVARKTVERAIEKLPLAMSAYRDGGFPEGPAGYWQYATSFNAIALAALTTAYGTDFGLGETPGFDRQLDYIDALTGPLGVFFCYSDAGINPREPDGTVRGTDCAPWYLAKRFARPEALARGEIAAYRRYCTGWSNAERLFPLTLLWLPPGEVASGAGEWPAAQRFGGEVPVAVLRRGVGRDSEYVAVKGGTGRANHAHLDVGSFAYDAGGVRWTYDPGSESYNKVEQAGVDLWNREDDSERWTVFRVGSFAHGVLMLDGRQQRPSGFADVRLRDDVPGAAAAELDMTALYPGVRKVTRTLALAERGASELSVTDLIEGARPGMKVRWQQLTRAEATPQPDGSLVLARGGRTLRVVPSRSVEWFVESVAEPAHKWDSPNPGVIRYGFETVIPESGKLESVCRFRL